jgi:hypothetical protein
MGVLRKMFGPSREEIWRQLSAEIDGRYVERPWKREKVEAMHGPWMVTLDRYVVSTGKSAVVYTRMRAPYVNAQGFRFTIYRKGIFSNLGKWLGMQDVEVGYPQFDEDFIIKGNDTARLRELFSNERLRGLIEAQPAIHFEVKDDEGWFGAAFPQGVDELVFMVLGVIKDVERLKLLYDLFAETLDQLCRIGSAYETSAGVELQ